MNKDTRNIVATAVGAIVTVALPFLRLHPLIALLFGVAAFFVARDAIPVSPKLKKGSSTSPELDGGSGENNPAAEEKSLAFAAWTANRFKETAERIADAETASTVNEIARLVEALVENFRQDPGDLRLPAAQTFLHTNLDRALRLVESYARLSAMDAPPAGEDQRHAERQRSLRDAEEAIRLTRKGFQALLTECQENDLRQMDVDSHVLTQMLEDRFPQLADAEQRALKEQANGRQKDENIPAASPSPQDEKKTGNKL